MDKYLELSPREKNLITCGMSDVIDIMDSKEGGHIHALTEMQYQDLKEYVCATQEYERLCGGYLNDEDIVALIKKKNWTNILRTMYSKLTTASADTFPMLKIITHICDIHLRHKASILPDVVAKLSEASIVIKFWATIIEALFCETDLLVNWGDTISYGPEKTNCKMDLRILCNLETSNDIVSAEFGRTVKESKYFQDKAKLIANGKAQLNNLIKATKDKSMAVALILIQACVLLAMDCMPWN
ncbi:hypothetical protein G6F46_012432 [Rhizopus delemar]|uniref:Uncharacterized protein n=1 Tax=Rhizopus delemar (strain RA 99-880 / ATCC MYA-4621 / FGSC 9543 / NRRL 43880) TaxID=246409 RepID=I1BM36_RHIO9|nr:hypothetical protein RO3G_01970 [Rhizopus delemar RA 99-880]KAG1491167.1 hypothetical protein G6F54_010211 [Rhizopus delemar]KAG1498849.1 hypothetical protein G6F53_011656 [Rhizopus delemar]KAG1501668.1 hypothetical protein G6F52_012439 [Rhizopus delemar]KAG1539268.1 hypothetical protein G6F49_012406 [Rhizopus delemar]|eukprot:EIE77266.1 hypothetical protein RO3G_01970 [Rhizopus delemar RA 99-880]